MTGQFAALIIQQDRIDAVVLFEFFQIRGQRRLSFTIVSLRGFLRGRPHQAEIAPWSVRWSRSHGGEGKKQGHHGQNHSQPKPEKHFEKKTSHKSSSRVTSARGG